MTTFRVYVTAEKRYAVHIREDPDWAGLATAEDGDADGDGRQRWAPAWHEKTERTLRIFADVVAMVDELPRGLIEDLDV